MVLGFSKPKAVKLFISHKERDRCICTKISENLKREFDDDLDIFLSSDAKCIPGGKDWQETIEKNLREADWLFFVYLNPRQVWDWCFYEAGFFLGSSDGSGQRSERFIVLHPGGVSPPAPLAKIQAVGAKVTAIEERLRQMLADTRSGTGKSDADWSRIAESIAEDVQAAGIQFFDGRYQLTAKCPMTVNPDDPLDVAVDVEHAQILVEKGAQELFGIGIEDGISWRRFGEHLNEKKEVNSTWERAFDFYALKDAAVCVRRDKHLGVVELQSFRVGNVGYRPIITGADLKQDGTVYLTLYLVKIPDSLDPRSTNAFDAVYQSLSLGCQLRREVIERNESRLEGLTPDDPKAKELLTNIWRALESVVADANNRGLTRERTREAFEETAWADLDDLREKWWAVYNAFERATEEIDVESSKQLFTVLRHINVHYLKIAEARLKQLLEKARLPDTEMLRKEFKALLPARRKGPRRGPARQPSLSNTKGPSRAGARKDIQFLKAGPSMS